MRAADIVTQLVFVLPSLTGRFSDEVGITSIQPVGSDIEVITDSAHGLSVGDFVNIVDVISPNFINDLTSVGKIATAITDNKHDLIEPRVGICTVDIIGATDPAYNGKHNLLTVPSRTSFTYQLDSVPAISPDTGVPRLEEFFVNRGFNGRHEVIAVPGSNLFTYTVASFLPPSAGAGGFVRSGHRITRAESIESAMETYTREQEGELWAYAVLDSSIASKDRNITSDAGQQKTAGSDPRQNIIFNASIFVFFPATDEIRAGGVRDLAQSEVLANIIGSIVGANLPTGLTEDVWGKVTYEGDNKFFYDRGVYIHQYDIQQTADLTFCDRVPPSISVPFEEIDFSLFEEDANIVATGSTTL
jgi:hypothetical protein